MLAYNYDPETHVFTNSETVQENPLKPGNFLLPAHATFTEPPEEKTGFMRIWNGAEWEYSALPPRTTCTKYELVTCLQTYFPELLASLRQAYAASSDLQFYWNTVNDLDRSNADFQSFAHSLGVTSEQLDAIFAKIGE